MIPRLPIMVPRAVVRMISPEGVTRFWSGIACSRSSSHQLYVNGSARPSLGAQAGDAPVSRVASSGAAPSGDPAPRPAAAPNGRIRDPRFSTTLNAKTPAVASSAAALLHFRERRRTRGITTTYALATGKRRSIAAEGTTCRIDTGSETRSRSGAGFEGGLPSPSILALELDRSEEGTSRKRSHATWRPPVSRTC
jgi:hypothetical protein